MCDIHVAQRERKVLPKKAVSYRHFCMGLREQTFLSHPPLILLLPEFRWLGSLMHADAPQWELLAFLEALSAETFKIKSPSSCRPRRLRISARLNIGREAKQPFCSLGYSSKLHVLMGPQQCFTEVDPKGIRSSFTIPGNVCKIILKPVQPTVLNGFRLLWKTCT